MKCRVLLVLLCSAFVLDASAASKARIDATSEESTDSSIQIMRTALSNKENCLLSAAFMRLQIADKNMRAKETGNADEPPGPLGPKINGMTYKEILKKSEHVEANIISLCRS